MTKGDAGQNISKFASSSTEASSISTSMPYVSYIDLASWLETMYEHAKAAVDVYFKAHLRDGLRSAERFAAFCKASSNYSDVFVCDGYRLCRAAKLLMSLGYGNFATVIQYDIYAMAEKYMTEDAPSSWNVGEF